MGAGASIEAASANDVVKHIYSMGGDKYQKIAKELEGVGVDGAYLCRIAHDDQAVDEMFKELGVTSKIIQRKFRNNLHQLAPDAPRPKESTKGTKGANNNSRDNHDNDEDSDQDADDEEVITIMAESGLVVDVDEGRTLSRCSSFSSAESYPSPRFLAFLSHHKEGAAATAQLLKLAIPMTVTELLENEPSLDSPGGPPGSPRLGSPRGSPRLSVTARNKKVLAGSSSMDLSAHHASQLPIFLDSDNLHNLEDLVADVKASLNLIVLLTAEIFTRPWCLVEITTAAMYSVNMVPIQLVGPSVKAFQFPADVSKYSESLVETLPEGVVTELHESGYLVAEVAASIAKLLHLIGPVYDCSSGGHRKDGEMKDIASRLVLDGNPGRRDVKVVPRWSEGERTRLLKEEEEKAANAMGGKHGMVTAIISSPQGSSATLATVSVQERLDRAISANKLTEVVQVMLENFIDVDIQILGCVACRTFATASVPFRTSLGELNACSAIVKAMASFPSNAILQIRGLEALCNLSIDHTVNRDLLVEAGAPNMVIAALHNHPADVDLQMRGFQAARNMCLQHPGNKSAFESAMIFNVFVAAMSTHSNNVECVVQALACMVNLITKSEESKARLAAEPGALGVIVAALQTHVKQVTVVEVALQIIANISNGSAEVSRKLGEMGACRYLCQALLTNPSAAGVQNRGLWAMYRLAAGCTLNRELLVALKGQSVVKIALDSRLAPDWLKAENQAALLQTLGCG